METPQEFTAFYARLRAIGAQILRGEREGHTLQPTALVHEAYLRMASQTTYSGFDRATFFPIAIRVMRQVLVDHARRRQSQRRGGSPQRITLSAVNLATEPDIDVLILEDALGRLEQLDSRQCRIVEMRFFGGMSVPEVADALSISEKTVKRDWAMARAWLSRELRGETDRQ
jgi:RNA polymerase sigma factor (TIGR02999 family)